MIKQPMDSWEDYCTGQSAYDLAVICGYKKSFEEWLLELA